MEDDPNKSSTSKKIKLDPKAESETRQDGPTVYTDMFLKDCVITNDSSTIGGLSFKNGASQKQILVKQKVKELVDDTVEQYKIKIKKLLGRLVKAENTLKETEDKHEKSETKLKSVEIKIMNYKKKIKSLREEISKNEENITAMKELNKVIIETFEKLNSDVEDYIKKISDLEKEINDVKFQNKKLIKKVNSLETMLDEKDHRINTLTKENKETERKKEELQQQLDTVLDEVKRKGLLTLLKGESQVGNNESLRKLIKTQKEKTCSEVEGLKELQLPKINKSTIKQKIFRLEDLEFDIPSTSSVTQADFDRIYKAMLLASDNVKRVLNQCLTNSTKQEFKSEINDISSPFTLIKTELQLGKNKNKR